MHIDQYMDLLLKGEFPGVVAVAIFLLLMLWKKAKPDLWKKIPKRWQWVIPVLVGFLSCFAASLAAGNAWADSALRGFLGTLEGFFAMGIHHGLKTSALPYGVKSKKPNITSALLVLMALWLSACAAPCQMASLLSAYKAEQLQCIRLYDNETRAKACIMEVRARYLPGFYKAGMTAAQEMSELMEGLNE
jgi:hypothetical protein